MNEPLKTRRDGKPAEPMTLEQVRALAPYELEGLEVLFDGDWVRPAKWAGSGDDIEVVL